MLVANSSKFIFQFFFGFEFYVFLSISLFIENLKLDSSLVLNAVPSLRGGRNEQWFLPRHKEEIPGSVSGVLQ